MRLSVASLAVFVVAAPAVAQERGSFVMDAMTTSGRHLGFGYYVTDNLSLRPTFGLGYAGGYGLVFNVGSDLRYEFLPEHRVTPYVAGGINYMRNPQLMRFDSGGSVLPNADTNALRYGGGAGLRALITRRISLVGEGRVMNSAYKSTFAGPTIREGTHYEAAAGVSYSFN